MPAPLGLSTQRHALLMIHGKCLQAGNVGSKSKLAIANAKRCQRIRLVEINIMSPNQNTAIDLIARSLNHWNFRPIAFKYRTASGWIDSDSYDNQQKAFLNRSMLKRIQGCLLFQKSVYEAASAGYFDSERIASPGGAVLHYYSGVVFLVITDQCCVVSAIT